MTKSEIIYRDINSPLGPMIGGATDQGVCLLEWHDRGGVERILTRIDKRYGVPAKTGNNQHLQKLEKELKLYFESKLKDFTVAVDVRGTPFQKKVWDALLEIPKGETRSYGQIAKAVGKPDAVRAVGAANGANYLAIVIPCHRVIDANGNLHGYGGKLWRKKYLLELESKIKQFSLQH